MDRLKTIRRKFTAANGREVTVTYFTIQGTTPGPVMTIIAGQHGMEHSGPNLLPEFMDELVQTDFAGTVHVCPCANPLALEIDYEFYPENEDLSLIDNYYYSIFRHNYCPWGLGRDNGDTVYNMNRLWNHPGNSGVAGQITRWLWDEICRNANIILDLHALQAEKPLIFSSHPKNNLIARYAGIEAVVMTDPNPSVYNAGNLSYQGSQGENQYTICIEFSRQHGLKESEYELGKQAIRNIMIGVNMVSGVVIPAKPVWLVPFHNRGQAMNVSHTGHIRYLVELYDRVRKGDKIYEVRDIQTIELLEEGFASNDGIVFHLSFYPVIAPRHTPCWILEAEQMVVPGEALEKLSLNAPTAECFGSTSDNEEKYEKLDFTINDFLAENSECPKNNITLEPEIFTKTKFSPGGNQ